MYNRVEELLKGGQTALQTNKANNKQTSNKQTYGVSLRITVYTPELRVYTVYWPPNYGDLPTLYVSMFPSLRSDYIMYHTGSPRLVLI